MLGAEPHVGVGGEMKDDVRTAHGAGQQRRIQRIAAYQT